MTQQKIPKAQNTWQMSKGPIAQRPKCLKIQKPKDLNAQISKSLKAFNLKLLTPSLHSVTRYIHNGGMSFYTWQQTIEIMAGCEGETKFLL